MPAVQELGRWVSPRPHGPRANCTAERSLAFSWPRTCRCSRC